MILYLDTATAVCRIWLDDTSFEYETDRSLARDLLGLIQKSIGLARGEQGLRSVTAIAVFRGPGSFTGLRIGATVANTLADQLQIPIVSEVGENWRELARQRLDRGEDDKIVLPEYGKPANITTPKN